METPPPNDQGIPSRVSWSLADLLEEGETIHILDVGAALLLEPPYQCLLDAGKARITGFEPDEQARETLQQHFGSSHVFHPHFVGAGGPATFHQTNWNFTGSLYAPNTPLLAQFNHLEEVMQPVASHAVQTVALNDLPEIRDVDFIKIDVQGSELSVFENAGRILKDVLVIQTEVEFVSLYQDQPLFADVDRFLRGAGFQFHTFLELAGRAFRPIVAPAGPYAPVRQFLWADAVYVADWMQLERLASERLRRYAVLAHDVLHSYDLAHRVLQELDRRSGELTADLYRLMLGQSGEGEAADPG